MSTHEHAPHSLNLRWFFGFFLVSGFCGLVYEVVWLRLAMASFGVTTALASIVISMFMAGLGVGSWGAGRLTRRVLAAGGLRSLRFYSIAELLVGVSSIAVPFELKFGRLLLQHMGSSGTWQTSRYYMLSGIWIAITLIPWCACMGSTFPLLMAVIRTAVRRNSERSFSYLYIANVLGALAGTLVSAFLLIELLGFQGTLYVAGTLNVLLALSALALSYYAVTSDPIAQAETDPAPRASLYGLPRITTLVFLFTTGMVSMGLEVIWIRQLTPYLGNVVYAFAGILAVYLLATVVGSSDYRSNAQSRRPTNGASAWSMLALFALVPLIAVDPSLSLGTGTGTLRLATIGLFCAMAGFVTPMLVDSWSSGDPDRAGSAYAVNIAGSIAGPLVAGFCLLPWLGERWSTAALALPLFAIAALVVFGNRNPSVPPEARRKSRISFAAAVVIGLLLFVMSHDYESHFADRVVRRDYSATVIATGSGFGRHLLVNGVGMTVLTPITKYIAHLPLAFMQRPPRNGLVICFGMGTSFRSMLSWGIPTTAVDLIPSVPKLFGYYHADAAQIESSPLARIVVDDGRRFLDSTQESYDVIVVDPPPPTQAAGSSLLYSREFYAVVRRHLRNDGILQAWFPAEVSDAATTVSVVKALRESFPYVRAFHSYDGFGIHFLASMQPIPTTSSAVLTSRMPAGATADFVEWGPKATPQQQFDAVLSQEVNLDALVADAPRTPAIEDDKPVNEYYLLRHWFGTKW